jgi:Mg2+ and Co2+ transporter CorA
MISKYSHKELNWVDLESPSKEETSHIVEQLSIPSYIVEKINKKTKEDIIDIDDSFIFASISNELIFVVNDNYILTIHSKPIQAFDKFGKEMELDIIVEENSKINNNKLLFAYLLKNLYLDLQNQSIINNTQIRDLEKQIIIKSKKLKLFIFLSIILLVATIIFICL